VLDYTAGDPWLSGVGLMVGLGPNPILDHVDQVAEAQRQLLEALLAEEPDRHDELSDVLYDLVTASHDLRFSTEALRFARDGEWEYHQLLERLLTPAMWERAFWSVYGLYRAAIDEPEPMAGCALATFELAALPPQRTEFWNCVLAATEADLEFEGEELELDGDMEAVDRVMQALLQREIELDIPPYALAYGALYLGSRTADVISSFMESHGVPEELDEVHLEEVLAVTTGGLLKDSPAEGEVDSQLENWMLDAFEVEAGYFIPVFTDRLAVWAAEVAGPDSGLDPELLDAVDELLYILYEPTEAQVWGLGPFLYFAGLTQFMASDQFEQLVLAPEILYEHADEFDSEDPELAEHLRWVCGEFGVARNEK